MFCVVDFLMVFYVRMLVTLCMYSGFIHPCVKSMLIIILICDFIHVFLPAKVPEVPFCMFLFTYFVRIVRCFRLIRALKVAGQTTGVVLKSAFS